ncbi:MAG TPA: cysteine--tRNA ligase [Candidatus Kapabacteria bacterium]|mgnify:CR=1 FL=1|nr:cysteine--tRNA ligase [Candidatus Kapabacteria bacterium]HPO62819.1 cysteine--tRNA ligase [Candidatus Kapabacteria bacterium]
MQINLYNSLTRLIEEFKPIKENLVRMYSCGPTVYNYAHIGNMRAFLFADLLQRVLRTVGKYEVNWVMNITNIDDKTIRDSKLGSELWKKEMGEQSSSPLENLLKFTKYYENEFLKDISLLGIDLNHFFAMPKATEYIDSMQKLILKIIDNGFAYISNGSVYFNVMKWNEADKYGKLFNIDFENFKAGTRIDTDQYEREQANDFALWKAKKEDEPYWEFRIDEQICDGRPGWHIECSAMEADLLKLPFDIHTGGIDLKFPHHEDEIAQSKAGYGVEPTAVWCHNEFLEVEGTKMSKSAGNFFTLRDLLDKDIDPIDIRFAILSAHYSSVFNFTFDGITASRKARLRVQDFIYSLFEGQEFVPEKIDYSLKTELINSLRNEVFSHLANNLHTPKALASLFSWLNNHTSDSLSNVEKVDLIIFFSEINNIFVAWDIKKQIKENIIPQEIVDLAELRLKARREKNFKESDILRDKLLDLGYSIKDGKDSYTLEKM